MAAQQEINARKTSSNFIDPQALMAIKNLELRAKMVVQGFRTGLHRSPFHGFSVEFSEYREYTRGDDPRYMDWRVFGRTDRYYIKKFEEETNLRCHLIVDQSRSMGFGSTGFSKAEYARTLAGTISYFLTQQSDAVGLFTFDDIVREYIPARHRPGHLRRLMLSLEKELPGKETNIENPLRKAAQMLRKRGLLLIISDFLAPIERLDAALRLLASAGHEIALFQVVDPAEEDFNFNQVALFKDMENAREIYIDPGQARASYKEQRDQHMTALGKLAQKSGAALHIVKTDRPMEISLFEFLEGRLKTGKRISQRWKR